MTWAMQKFKRGEKLQGHTEKNPTLLCISWTGWSCLHTRVQEAAAASTGDVKRDLHEEGSTSTGCYLSRAILTSSEELVRKLARKGL